MATLAKRLANNAPAERMRRTINDLVTQINGGGQRVGGGDRAPGGRDHLG
jgi:hypothetical protein